MSELAPAHRAAVLLGADCQRCPLYDRHEGPVMGIVQPGAKLVVVGEAPARAEVEEGKPFTSAGSGGLLDESLGQAGLTRADCTLTYAVLCRPPGGDMVGFLAEFRRKQRKLPKDERTQLTPQAACFARLQADLYASGNARTFLAVGNEGLKGLARHLNLPFHREDVAPGTPRATTIKRQHGSPIVLRDGRVVMATLHPAFAQHGKPEYAPVVRDDFRRAALVAADPRHLTWQEPEFLLSPSADEAVNFLAMLHAANQLTTVDIETDGIGLTTARIRCIGVGAVVDGRERIGVIPLEQMHTRLPWYRDSDMMRVRTALSAMLEKVPLSGHNLMFDTGVLLSQGLLRDRAKLWFDCYRDRDTEFLTERGWSRYDDVRADDRLATIRPDGSLEFQHFTDRVSKTHKGVLYKIETPHTRAIVTPGHRMWTRPVKRGARGAAVGAWGFTEMRDLLVQSPDTADVLRACVPQIEVAQPDPTIDGVELTPALLRFLGVAISDGTIRWRKNEPYRLIVSQIEEGRAASLLAEVQTALGLRRNGPYIKPASATRLREVRELRWTHPSSQIARSFREWVGRYSGARRLPSFTLTLPAEHRRALLAGLLVGDASPVGKQITYRSAHKALTDDVQALALSLGIPATTHRTGEVWGVALQVTQGVVARARMRTRDVDQNGAVTVIPGDGERIVCFIVPNHTLVTRSGGRPAFHGNTMIGHHDTRQSELPHDLGFVVARNFLVARWKEDADAKVVKGIGDAMLHQYCARDVLGELRLQPVIAAQVQQDGQLGAYSTDIQLAPIARDMTILGLPLDEKRRHDYFHTFQAAAARRRAEVCEIVGKPDFNPNATRQVADFLFLKQKLTPTYGGGQEWADFVEENEEEDLGLDLDDPETLVAKATTDEPALLRLLELGVDARSARFIEALLGFRAMQKTNTALGLKRDAEGKILDLYRARGNLSYRQHGAQRLTLLHPSWKLHVTPTGRWASQPNVQNWSERVVHDAALYRATNGKEGIINLRQILEAPEGYIFVGADYSQIELRLYAAKARDALLLEALAKGIDPHAWNYATMMARSASEIIAWYEKVKGADPKIKKHLRNIAKRFAYLIFYGGHKEKLAKTMRSDRNPDGSLSFPGLRDDEVAFWFDNWHRLHPETKAWQQRTIAFWTQHGFVETVLDGRRRYFLGGLDETAIPNMTIQGSAAAIANRAMLQIGQECPYLGWGPLAGPAFQCHDELVVQVPVERAAEAEALLHRAMPWTDPADGMVYPIEQLTRRTLAGG